MRPLADLERIRAFMREISRGVKQSGQVYLTGGACAVLEGWRESTIDVDVKLLGDDEALFRNLPLVKEAAQVNVELASPSDFIPEIDGWQTRSIFIAQEGKVSFYHYDPYSQALAKLERHHPMDLEDVRSMISHGWVDPQRLLDYFGRMEEGLYRYPAITPAKFRAKVERFLEALRP